MHDDGPRGERLAPKLIGHRRATWHARAQGSGRSAGGVLMLMTVDAARAADAAALRKNFDDYAARVQAARANKASNNLGGGITWGDSYEMDAYLLMYEATQDADYMDSFVMMADMVNTARADKAGTPDWKGVLHHGWLTDGPYTLGQPVTVLDKAGKPSIEVQAVAQQNNNSATIEIAPDAKKPGEFSIYVYNQATGQQPGHWDGLTPETVEAKVNVPGSPIKVKKLGDTVPIHHNPFTPPTQCCVLLSHQSGRVLAPFAKVAVMVKKYPDMAGLAHRAEMYLTTAEETFAELEAEGGWVDAPDGGGYYKIEKGAPIWCDGVPDTPYALSALGTALLYMNDATGKEIYKTRATQLATFVKGLIKSMGARPIWTTGTARSTRVGRRPTASARTPRLQGLKQPEKIEYMQTRSGSRANGPAQDRVHGPGRRGVGPDVRRAQHRQRAGRDLWRRWPDPRAATRGQGRRHRRLHAARRRRDGQVRPDLRQEVHGRQLGQGALRLGGAELHEQPGAEARIVRVQVAENDKRPGAQRPVFSCGGRTRARRRRPACGKTAGSDSLEAGLSGPKRPIR